MDKAESAREICPTRLCQARDPMTAKSVEAVKPDRESEDRVKTGRGTREGKSNGESEEEDLVGEYQKG